jgi:hypothetical protein
MTDSCLHRKHEEPRNQSPPPAPCAPTRPQSRALFVGLNCAHSSTMTSHSEGLSLQQELYRPTAVTRHPPGKAISERDTISGTGSRTNSDSLSREISTQKTGTTEKRTVQNYHFNYTLLSAVIPTCTICCDI